MLIAVLVVLPTAEALLKISSVRFFPFSRSMSVSAIGTLFTLPLCANKAVPKSSIPLSPLAFPANFIGAPGRYPAKPATEPMALATDSMPVCGAGPRFKVVNPDKYPVTI